MIDFVSILTLGLVAGIGLSFVPIIIGVAVRGILKIFKL